MFIISTNGLGRGTPEDIKEALGGLTGKGSEDQSGSNFGSSGFPSSPVQRGVTFTVASFPLKH